MFALFTRPLLPLLLDSDSDSSPFLLRLSSFPSHANHTTQHDHQEVSMSQVWGHDVPKARVG